MKNEKPIENEIEIEEKEIKKKKKTNGFANFVEGVGVIGGIISFIVIIVSLASGSSDVGTEIAIGIGAFISCLLIITLGEILNTLIDIFNKLR